MDAPAPQTWLYDPVCSAQAVRAHRPSAGGAATCVVSDVLWGDVLALVRWARATSVWADDRRAGAAGRTAAAAAALLRRLPSPCDERGEPWTAPDERTTSGPARRGPRRSAKCSDHERC